MEWGLIANVVWLGILLLNVISNRGDETHTPAGAQLLSVLFYVLTFVIINSVWAFVAGQMFILGMLVGPAVLLLVFVVWAL